MYDEPNNPIGTYDGDQQEIHVGNSAQLTSALSASREPPQRIEISARVQLRRQDLVQEFAVLRTGRRKQKTGRELQEVDGLW
jgi:hypothetical protein